MTLIHRPKDCIETLIVIKFKAKEISLDGKLFFPALIEIDLLSGSTPETNTNRSG